jgi:hypothetical protein
VPGSPAIDGCTRAALGHEDDLDGAIALDGASGAGLHLAGHEVCREEFDTHSVGAGEAKGLDRPNCSGRRLAISPSPSEGAAGVAPRMAISAIVLVFIATSPNRRTHTFVLPGHS